LIHFLRAPQAGVPVIQTTGGITASWVSAADMMSLVALIFGMFGEISVLTFSLWLPRPHARSIPRAARRGSTMKTEPAN
jgi:hypothetical protein